MLPIRFPDVVPCSSHPFLPPLSSHFLFSFLFLSHHINIFRGPPLSPRFISQGLQLTYSFTFTPARAIVELVIRPGTIREGLMEEAGFSRWDGFQFGGHKEGKRDLRQRRTASIKAQRDRSSKCVRGTASSIGNTFTDPLQSNDFIFLLHLFVPCLASWSLSTCLNVPDPSALLSQIG